MRKALFGLSVVILIIFAFYESKPEEVEVFIGDSIVYAELAKTEEERRIGLSRHAQLKKMEGLLMVYNSAGRYGIWMKEMSFPIDIIWISEDQRIVDFKEDASPESYPEIFRPEYPARYVLEVNSGFVERFNIDRGDKVDFEL